MSYEDKDLEDIISGKAPLELIVKMQRSPKDKNRFEKYLGILQRRVGWKDRILLPLSEHLFIVEKRDRSRVVRCDCGHEFGDYRENWKLEANIFVRDNAETLEEIYAGPRSPDPRICEVREYYCPNCSVLLEVEALPPGYQPVFHFLPDIDMFYREWLKKPLPESKDSRWFSDLSIQKVKKWQRDREALGLGKA